jgi:hypothetical protein
MSVNELFSTEQRKQLYANNEKALELDVFEPNFKPVVCMQAKGLGYTFLVTQLEERDLRVAFCLCDKGNERLTLEAIDMYKLEEEVEKQNDQLVLDPDFVGKYPLVVYAKVAEEMGRIVTDDQEPAAKKLFDKFSKLARYQDENKSMRRFHYGIIW